MESQSFVGLSVSSYRIIEELGGGGIGVVYKAEDAELGRFVVLMFPPNEVAKDLRALSRAGKIPRWRGNAGSRRRRRHRCPFRVFRERKPYVAAAPSIVIASPGLAGSVREQSRERVTQVPLASWSTASDGGPFGLGWGCAVSREFAEELSECWHCGF
jgi:hypothetical protein